MLCSPGLLSLLAKLITEKHPHIDPQGMFETLYLQNVSALPENLLNEARLTVPSYDPTIRTASFLPVQKIEAIVEYQKACSDFPVFDRTEVKQITDELLRDQCEKLEGYGATFRATISPPPVTLDPLDFPPTERAIVSQSGIVPNKACGKTLT